MDAIRVFPLLILLSCATGCYRWSVPAEEVPLTTARPASDPGPLKPDGTPNPSDQYGDIYLVGAEDVLDIQVTNHPEFSGEVTVDKHGKFAIPLLNNREGARVHAKGLSLEQITEIIRQRISEFVLDDPPMFVKLKESNSKFYIVMGYVARQGRFRMGDTQVHVSDALMRAKLFRPGANTSSVLIITPDEYRPTAVTVHGWNIVTGRTRDNLVLKPNDIVFVPPRWWQKTAETVDQILRRTQAVEGIEGAFEFYDTEKFLSSSDATGVNKR